MNDKNTALIKSAVQQAWASESPLDYMRDFLLVFLEGVETKRDKTTVMFFLEGVAARLAREVGKEPPRFSNSDDGA